MTKTAYSFARIKTAVASAFAGLLLAGCALPQAGTVVTSPFFSSYDVSMVGAAGGGGGLLVETFGNPFEAPKAEVARTVAKHMEGANAGPAVPFVSEKPEGVSPLYRLRVGLNAGISAEGLCRAEGPGQEAAQQSAGAQRIDAVMAFCSGEKRISSVRGHANGITGPEDPTLRSLLRIMTGEILPQRDPNRIGNGDGDGDFE
ncbi:MAG: hypothetical protein R3316_03690 [Rhodovibrionaceae bacterium]|nr:hypothetical protein [Rhodovibrionaceae bacterium]